MGGASGPALGPGQSFSQFYSQFGLGRVANFFVEIWADLDAIWVEAKLLAIANIYSPPASHQRYQLASSARRPYPRPRCAAPDELIWELVPLQGPLISSALLGLMSGALPRHDSASLFWRSNAAPSSKFPACAGRLARVFLSLWHPPPPPSSASSRCATTCSATPS